MDVVDGVLPAVLRAEIDGRTLHIEVEDHGVGIENLEEAMKPYFTDKPDQERSGMGFTIMESFTDEMRVLKTPGGGVTVKMSKTFGEN